MVSYTKPALSDQGSLIGPQAASLAKQSTTKEREGDLVLGVRDTYRDTVNARFDGGLFG